MPYVFSGTGYFAGNCPALKQILKRSVPPPPGSHPPDMSLGVGLFSTTDVLVLFSADLSMKFSNFCTYFFHKI